MNAIPHSPLNLYTNPATRTLNDKNSFEYSWRVGFPVRAESDSLLSLAGWGWDSQHRRVRLSNPDDGMVKNSGVPSC